MKQYLLLLNEHLGNMAAPITVHGSVEAAKAAADQDRSVEMEEARILELEGLATPRLVARGERETLDDPCPWTWTDV